MARSCRGVPRRTGASAAGPVCPPGRVGARRVRLPRRPRTGGSGLSAGTAGPTDELLVGGLDLEEPRERSLTAGVGVVLLGEPAIGPLDLVERSTTWQPEDAIWIVDVGHAGDSP